MGARGAYWSVGKPKTQHSVCAYLDVLGFTAAVRNAESTGQSDELLARFSFIVRNWFTSLGDMFATESGEQRRREYRIFTDNVVVGGPVEYGTRTELAFTIDDLALLQIGLIAEGFFIRGGASVGSLYIDDEVVYGGALLDAHDAEQVARGPRVVLHSSAVDAVREEVAHYTNTYGELRGHRFTDAVLVDEDGVFFVNYLVKVYARGIFDPDHQTLEMHRTVVQKRLDEHASDERVRSKYVWAARYHNYFCEHLAGGREYRIAMDLPALAAQPVENYT